MTDNSTKIFDPVLLLESIRAGIPSRQMIEQLPDLRSHITQKIEADLDELETGNAPRGRIIWGEYGQGKTHFLKMTEQQLLHKGYAVSYYTLNRDLGLNNLKVLFPVLANQTLTGDNMIPGIMNQLASDNLPQDLMDLLRQAESGILHPLPSLILQAFLQFRDADEMLLLYNALMGNQAYWAPAKAICRKAMRYELRAMPKFTIKEHGQAFFEFFPYLLRILGYKGWVILIDEAELIGKLGKVGRLNSYLNLSYLLNWNEEHKHPFYTLVASAKTLQSEVFYGRRNDVDKMPAAALERFDRASSRTIKNFFDLAGNSNQNLMLNPIQKEDYLKLYTQIFDLHRQALPWKKDADKTLIPLIENTIKAQDKPIRAVLRMFIEILDVFAYNGTLLDLEAIESQPGGEYGLEEEPEKPIDEERRGFTETGLDEMFDDI